MSDNPYDSLSDAQYAAVENADYHPPAASGDGTTCILVASASGLIGLQDSKLPADERRARTLIFNPAEMAAFVADAKAGAYDHLM
ncbi:MAG: DUF397 domain-containing protein [Pseudonocardiaceae bacterium]